MTGPRIIVGWTEAQERELLAMAEAGKATAAMAAALKRSEGAVRTKLSALRRAPGKDDSADARDQAAIRAMLCERPRLADREMCRRLGMKDPGYRFYRLRDAAMAELAGDVKLIEDVVRAEAVPGCRIEASLRMRGIPPAEAVRTAAVHRAKAPGAVSSSTPARSQFSVSSEAIHAHTLHGEP